MLLSIVYGGFRFLLQTLVSRRHRNANSKLLVLRHQPSVLQRTAGQPRWRLGDRIVLALTSQLARPAWRSLLVTLETVLRWRRELVRRKWAAFGRRRRLGRRPIAGIILAGVALAALLPPVRHRLSRYT